MPQYIDAYIVMALTASEEVSPDFRSQSKLYRNPLPVIRLDCIAPTRPSVTRRPLLLQYVREPTLRFYLYPYRSSGAVAS